MPLIGVVAIALVIGGAIAFVVLRRGDGAKRAKAPPAAKGSRGVSVEEYRASYRQRLEAARQVVARRRAAQVAAAAGDAGVASDVAREVREQVVRQMMEPRCILGPGELCATLGEPVDECAAGDGRACLAVGQYLADTPPRPMAALSFFHYACRAGDEEGCARMKEAKEPMDTPCADDPFRCAWVALEAKDKVRMDEACTEGVADACAYFLTEYEAEPERARTYLERSCQLGNPMACEELGRRLRPGCTPRREVDDGKEIDWPCYPPDAAEAAEARTIACEAGFAEACD